MNYTNSKGLSVITVPAKMKKHIEKVQKLRELKKQQNDVMQIRKGDVNNPVITCRNSKLNHYRGQSYSKFDSVPLASSIWTSKRTRGDSFIIHNHSQNPAFAGAGEEDDSPNFEDLGLDLRLVEHFKNVGYEIPTNIQTLAIPKILERLNTVVSSETGNGKTLAFLAPIIHQILQSRDAYNELESALNSPQALILLPSRELVAQTRDMARELCGDLGIRINSLFGGHTKKMMLRPKAFEHDIVLGSFGAVSKLFTNRIYQRHRVNHIVLDEADTLLDDSFNEQMGYFLSKFPLNDQINDEDKTNNFTGVQLTLVGATFPRNMKSILKHTIDVDALTEVKTPYLHRISPHVTHTFLKVGDTERLELLLKMAKKNFKNKIPTIIFSNTSKCSNFVFHFLKDNELPCMNVNGEMDAYERINRFQRFQDGEFNFISCTDLVSRGLNTVRAQHIINFEFPSFMSDYIHRSGRTGRVGGKADGNVTNFIYRKSQIDLVQKIEYACRKIVELPNVNANIKRFIKGRVERKRKEEQQAEMIAANKQLEHEMGKEG